MKPWILESIYANGVHGQKICIVGHSHHGQRGTRWVVRQHIAGQLGYSFFSHIQRYFGSKTADFWNRVMFFNFLPESVGSAEHRFAAGSPDEIARGAKRFLRMVAKYRPSKVLVFTTKGWRSLGPLIQSKSGKSISSLGNRFPQFSWGSYTTGNHTAMIFGLRHPQGAPRKTMEAAVKRILEMPRLNKKARS